MTDLSSAWPSLPVASGVRHTITEFYRLLDIYTTTACRQWAELFTTDGDMVIEARGNLHVQGRQGTYSVILIDEPEQSRLSPSHQISLPWYSSFLTRGNTALEAERKQSWIKLEKRDHRTHGIYVRNSEGTDLVVLGENEVTMRNGVVFRQGYAQRFVLRSVGNANGQGEEQYLIERFQSYLVRCIAFC